MTYDLTDRLLLTPDKKKQWSRYRDHQDYTRANSSAVERLFSKTKKSLFDYLVAGAEHPLDRAYRFHADFGYLLDACMNRYFPETHRSKMYRYYDDPRALERLHCDHCGCSINFFNKTPYYVCKTCNGSFDKRSRIQRLFGAGNDSHNPWESLIPPVTIEFEEFSDSDFDEES